MATFETAAEELAKKIATLEEILDKADDRFDDLRKQLGTLEEGINEDFTELVEQARSFFSKLQEERESLAREVNEAGQKVVAAENQVGESRGEVERSLGEAEGSLEGLTGNLTALVPQVESLVAEGAETPSQAIGQMAGDIQTSMTQALDAAREMLDNEVTDELDQMRQDLEDRVEALETSAREAGERVERAYSEFATRLDEATSLVEDQAFEAAGKHVKEVVDYAVEECAKAHEQEIETLGDMATDLGKLLDGLKDELETSRDRVKEEGQDALRTDMEELTTAVGAAQAALDQVKDLLASYTFVQM